MSVAVAVACVCMCIHVHACLRVSVCVCLYTPAGINPRTLCRVFEQIVSRKATFAYTVEFSILEIYNEEIRDLIEPGKDKKLDIRQAHTHTHTHTHTPTPTHLPFIMHTIRSHGSIGRSYIVEGQFHPVSLGGHATPMR